MTELTRVYSPNFAISARRPASTTTLLHPEEVLDNCYHWTLSKESINSGQGGRGISIDTSGEENVTPRVEVKALLRNALSEPLPPLLRKYRRPPISSGSAEPVITPRLGERLRSPGPSIIQNRRHDPASECYNHPRIGDH